ncbi:hypothetical protein H633G_11423, partial [Metarhizium anisopliae BRIP 53284]
MALSEDQIRIIAENPLGDALKNIRIKLRHGDDVPSESIVASLLGALVTSSAALDLPAPDGTTDVAEKLFIIRRNVRRGTPKLENFKPLIDVVVTNSTDAEIWAAVIDLINTVHPGIPPPSTIAPTFKGTPVKTSSSRLADSETRDI